MTDAERALISFEPQSIEAALESLVRLGRRWKKGEAVVLPLVTLQLRNGRDVEGSVIDAHESRGGHFTLLFSPKIPGRRGELMLVHFGSLEALTLQDPSVLADVPVVAAEAPSDLQLNRRAKTLADQLTAAAGVAIPVELMRPPGELGRAALGAVLEALSRVLQTVSADELGREALRTNLTRLLVQVGDAPLIERKGPEVHVTTAVGAQSSDPELRTRLDAVL